MELVLSLMLVGFKFYKGSMCSLEKKKKFVKKVCFQMQKVGSNGNSAFLLSACARSAGRQYFDKSALALLTDSL